MGNGLFSWSASRDHSIYIGATVKSSQKSILAMLGLIACVLLGFVSYYGVQAYQFYAGRPLGPAFPAFTPSLPPAAWPPAAGIFISGPPLAPTISFATKTPR